MNLCGFFFVSCKKELIRYNVVAYKLFKGDTSMLLKGKLLKGKRGISSSKISKEAKFAFRPCILGSRLVFSPSQILGSSILVETAFL